MLARGMGGLRIGQVKLVLECWGYLGLREGSPYIGDLRRARESK